MNTTAEHDNNPVVGDEQKQARSREAGEVNTNTVSTPPHPVEEAVALTPERIAELRKIAEGASPGPWAVTEASVVVSKAPWPMWDGPEWHDWTDRETRDPVGRFVGETATDTAEGRANALHIATFNPAFVLALLSALERQKEALEEAEAGLRFAGADVAVKPGAFVPAPTLALRTVRAALNKEPSHG